MARQTPIQQAQEFLQTSDIDAWLIYDYQGVNPALTDLTGLGGFLTRPVFLHVPPSGLPTLLLSAVDAGQVPPSELQTSTYISLEDAHQGLRALLSSERRVAMEYSPNRELPRASRVDAGTVELVRSLGVDVVSSAELLQYATQRWSEAGLASHRRAVNVVYSAAQAAFTEIGRGMSRNITESDISDFIMERFAAAGMETNHGPVVAANSHGSDPHFTPTSGDTVAFKPGDWVLIDLWAREPGSEGIYADITWVAYVGSAVPPEHQHVFDVVSGGRDTATEFLRERIASGENAMGWEVDQVARDFIARAGYGGQFVHRLGHSLGAEVHAGGVNLDNLETHDTRTFLPRLGFTIEPGIYLPEFGVRSEIDLFIGPDGLEVTTPVQRDVVLIG